MQLLIATHNPHKMREYRQIFQDLPLELVSLDDVGITAEVEETGKTFEENARLKAHVYCQASHLPTLADDSGLEVEALGGEPGVRSARYAGAHATAEQRYRLLLERMKHVPPGQRQARFRCLIALAQPNGSIQVVEGICPGQIALEPKGMGGFGYDPVFYLPSFGRTMAELSDTEKNRISHRGLAAAAIKDILRQLI